MKIIDAHGRTGIQSKKSLIKTKTVALLDNNNMAGLPSGMTVEFDMAPSVAASATGLQQTLRVGLHNSEDATAPTNGLYFQYNTTTTAGNMRRHWCGSYNHDRYISEIQNSNKLCWNFCRILHKRSLSWYGDD